MNLLTLDLNLLRVLNALLTEHSTVRAGAAIGLSQPAVSAALGRLRVALNDPLFVRQGQHLVPTEFARGLETPLQHIFDELSGLLSGSSRAVPAQAAGAFMISGSDFFAEMLMPDLALYLAKHAPGIQVQLVNRVPDNAPDRLRDRAIDMALIPETRMPGWLDQTRAFQSRFVVIARRQHPRLALIAPGGPVPLDLFCDIPQVTFSPEGHLRTMGDAALAAIGRQRRVMMTMPVFGGICRVVATTDLLALMPAQIAARMAPQLHLNIYEPPMHIQPVQIALIWHRRVGTEPIQVWLRHTVLDILANMIQPAAPALDNSQNFSHINEQTPGLARPQHIWQTER